MSQPRYTFARVPGYDVYTGDKRIYTTVRRNEFVCFVIDLETMKGEGRKFPTLTECKHAADYFAQHYKFPEQ